MAYLTHILTLLGLYTILATSLNLAVGYCGLASVAHAAFFGIGAYVAALASLRFHTGFPENVVLAVIAAGAAGAAVASSTLRMRGEYFVIATFSFQIIAVNMANNFIAITGGPIGLPGIPPVSMFGIPLSSHRSFVVLVWLVCAGTLLLAYRIVFSPYGRVLTAIREDESFAEAMTKDVSRYRVGIIISSASMASIAGVLYAHYISFIDPTAFTLMESILILSMVIIGGAGSLRGPVLGALLLVTLPEALRFVGMPSAIAANMRQIIYGALLVAFMMWRPQGLVGQYSFRKEGGRE